MCSLNQPQSLILAAQPSPESNSGCSKQPSSTHTTAVILLIKRFGPEFLLNHGTRQVGFCPCVIMLPCIFPVILFLDCNKASWAKSQTTLPNGLFSICSIFAYRKRKGLCIVSLGQDSQAVSHLVLFEHNNAVGPAFLGFYCGSRVDLVGRELSRHFNKPVWPPLLYSIMNLN